MYMIVAPTLTHVNVFVSNIFHPQEWNTKNDMYQGCNKTALCSQKNIAEGFYELLKEKEYSKITAS